MITKFKETFYTPDFTKIVEAFTKIQEDLLKLVSHHEGEVLKLHSEINERTTEIQAYSEDRAKALNVIANLKTLLGESN